MITLKQETLERMDALLAEKVMGFKWGRDETFKEEGWIQGEKKNKYIFVRSFRPSTNLEHAWMIANQLTKDNGLIKNGKLVRELDSFDLIFEQNVWTSEFSITSSKGYWKVDAKTPELAISLSALVFAGVGITEFQREMKEE
ncbi:hypothetical protein SIM22_03805 [Bacillus cereus group sp. BfR-BA-01363]|uniref:BC1872 family protein n=1 Tax=Bacillus cereus group sp. BfR-BA-01363 TaxID=3094882 RepID=UPI0029C24B32|nr:hypothetical protein [Bacillus cereus group sp. BfR-BA-01363]MDX5853251.1 hypothetical protein [Bacillus cereus group sp. BfR-BA-01363]